MCLLILDFILDIFNITWDPGFCLSSVEIVDISVFHGQLSWLGLVHDFEPTLWGS